MPKTHATQYALHAVISGFTPTPPVDKPMIETDTNETIENTLNLVFSSAHRISRRASVGWALLNECNVMLAHKSMMAGVSITNLSAAVKEYNDRISHLILTVEPNAAYCDLQELLYQLELSNCATITIGYRLPQALQDSDWLAWVNTWEGEVRYAGYTGIAENLTAGIRSMLTANRPWVSAISASTIENQTLPLANLQHEFGFSAYLDNLTKQNRAILFNNTQKAFAEKLPKVNWAGQTIDFYNVEEPAHARTVLQECANKKHYSVLLLSDPNKLSHYAKLNMADEIYHHIAITNMASGSVETPEFLKLEDWTIISSDVVGNCIRMNIKRNNNIAQLNENLRNRLN